MSTAIGEILARYGAALRDNGALGVAVALGVVLVALPDVRKRVAAWPLLPRVTLVLVIGLGGYLSWSLLWASDDAYISFRYARNLVRGEGLVFNPGERVEGYTDFFWTLLLALFIRLGVHPAHAGIALSMLSFFALIWLLARLGERLSPAHGLLVGLAPMLAAVSYTLASFATSALETVFAAMLAVLALERALANRPFSAGLCGILATLSHPDHALFYAALGGAMLWDRDRRAQLVRYGAPFVAIFVPYFLWRWSYYGDPMPNTYYVKSADKAYVAQGIKYFWFTFFAGGLCAVLPLTLIGIYRARATLAGRFALLALPLYLAYVVKIGGDFMLGRLFAPVLAFCFLFADLGFRDLIGTGSWRRAAALGAVASLALLRTPVLRTEEVLYGVADERTFTRVRNFARMEFDASGYQLGKLLHEMFKARGVSPRVGLFSLGMAAYEADLPVFDLRGLTSRSVAHLPLTHRGRPGHEKLATPGHLLEAALDLAQMPLYPPPYQVLSEARVSAFSLHLVRYDPPVVSALQRRATLTNFPAYLDAVLPKWGAQGPDRLACDLWHAREYYFSRNDDPSRRDAVRLVAARTDPNLAPVRALLLEPRELSSLGYARVRGFSFAADEPVWAITGDAADFSRSTVLQRDQGLVWGQDGPFLSTYGQQRSDRVQGTATSPEFVLEGDVLSFRIAGGFDPARLRFALFVDGAPVRTATGCDSEWLDRRVWDIRGFRGHTGKFVISDGSSAGWGHVIVDEVVEWRALRAP